MPRKRVVTLALFLAALLAGCAAKAPVETEWVASRDGAEDFDAARRACKARAVAESKDLKPAGMGARVAGGIFIKCMRDKGWELREKITLEE